MRNFLLKLIGNLVDFPDDVKIEEAADQYGQVYSLTINQADMGKIIGKSGRTIRAIRDLVKVRAIKAGERANLILVEQPQTDSGSHQS